MAGEDCAQLSPAHTRLCPVYPVDTLCAAEIRGAVCQRYISFVYSLDRLFAQYLFAALSYFDVSVYSQIVEQVDTPTSNHNHYVN